jgi:hypothetical protein
MVWLSEGLIAARWFPASSRVQTVDGEMGMIRSALLGTVSVPSGEVRVFQRRAGDSLAAAWARIAAPLVEPAAALPAELREGQAYPDERLLAQARILESPAWRAGILERRSEEAELLPPAGPGGATSVVPYLRRGGRGTAALLSVERRPTEDRLRLMVLDTTSQLESSTALRERWARFPFQQSLRDSVLAAGGSFRTGEVRYALAREGVVAYQPAWSLSPSGRAHLRLVNVALARPEQQEPMPLGTGRTLADAWRNFRGEIPAGGTASPAENILREARRLMRLADSARMRGDLAERERALAELRRLLEPRR